MKLLRKGKQTGAQRNENRRKMCKLEKLNKKILTKRGQFN